MFAISLGYKTASVELRQKFAFDDEDILCLLADLHSIGINSAVYLSTCNRCELYVGTDVYAALEVLADFACVDISCVKNHVLIFEDESAIRHLFRVTCGFESMVLGEDEILGQVKRAFAVSKDNGFTDYEFNTVFKSAVTAAKKIKTETLISKSSVSVATLVAAKCHKFSEKNKTALIIGASGEIGNKICKNLLSYGDFEIFATVREKHVRESRVSIISYADRYSYVDRADIVISATKSPHFTVIGDTVRKNIQTNKPRLFVDLSVPRDIDDAVREIDGAQLITVDDFETIAKHNNSVKQQEFVSANDMVEHELDLVFKELLFHRSLAFLKEFSRENGGDDFMHFVYKFRDASDSKAFASFVETLERINTI
ncbi:MAG: glutamyl-tRNA reductase [Faecalibacterium sp.]|nr:glutamyl-tRNA reductase [Ruminococcus sp.]MCM1392966.1 glutamyl-tRNA reductase [Ruminococcus sp.]MCM1486580.1 glutamyl-tRNA reductase [Faecalibacterium sp.]